MLSDRQSEVPDLRADAPRLTRRHVLALSAGLGTIALAACSAPAAAPPQPPAAKPTTGAAPASQPTAAAKPAATAVTSQPAAKPKALATEIRYGSQSMAPQLDPQGSLGFSAFMAARQVFDCLVTWDPKGERIIPQLAAEWKRIDNLTLEFKLRDDVKFSNGEPFTAETVKFSADRLINSTNALHVSTKQLMATLQSPEIVNSTTVRLKTKEPDPILLNRLTLLFMLPPKYTADGGDLGNQPIGTGSFKVVDFKANGYIRYEANDSSWRGKPTVQKASIEVIPEAATFISALKTDRIDIAFSVPPDQIAGLQRDGFHVATVSSGATFMNALLPSHPLTRDKRVREAINLAVNRNEMLTTLQAGIGKAANQVMNPGMTGHFDDIRDYPFDPERAKSLIREAGYNGEEVLLSTTPPSRPLNEAVVGYLNAVGLKARIDQIELTTLSTAITRGWDKPLLSYTPDNYQMRDFDYIGIRFTKDWPSPQFESDEFTQLFRQQRSELDPEKRQALLRRQVHLLRDEHAALFLLWRDVPIAYSKKIAALDMNYDQSTHLWRVEKEA